MSGGIFTTDCSSSAWAWLDVGCLLQNVGTDVGTAVTSALEPVWIVLGILGIFLITIVAILAFSPNVKHIMPVFL